MHFSLFVIWNLDVHNVQDVQDVQHVQNVQDVQDARDVQDAQDVHEYPENSGHPEHPEHPDPKISSTWHPPKSTQKTLIKMVSFESLQKWPKIAPR